MRSPTSVLAAPDRSALAQALAAGLGLDAHTYERETFPDGERYVRAPEGLEATVALVADVRPNDLLVEALLACDAAREAGAEALVLCIPYLSYARQDRSFQPGEAVSARALVRALRTGAEALVTVDPHKEAILGFFDGPTAPVGAAPEVAAVLAERGVDRVLAPDAGARERAAAVAEALDCPFDHLEKTRISATEVRMAPKDLDVQGGTVAIVDDIISTGGTMATATGQLLGAGAAKVLVAATHGLFVSGADKRLEEAGVAEVIVTDSVPGARSVVSCAPALARGVRALA